MKIPLKSLILLKKFQIKHIILMILKSVIRMFLLKIEFHLSNIFLISNFLQNDSAKSEKFSNHIELSIEGSENKWVRKYDHHCFWIGGWVGELNHRKFFWFLLLKFLCLLNLFDTMMSGYGFADNIEDYQTKFHVKTVFLFFIIIAIGFLFFVGILLFYHGFLIITNQTTWEHSRRSVISYLKVYHRTIFPFDYGIVNNIKMIMFHGNYVREWVLRHPQILRSRDGFNYWVNDYYNWC